MAESKIMPAGTTENSYLGSQASAEMEMKLGITRVF